MPDPIAPVVTRNAWRDAVWAASDLPPLQLLVALAYADHAGADTTEVWVSTKRGTARTGMGRTAWHAARNALVSTGWLVETTAATYRNAARYRLSTPIGGVSRHGHCRGTDMTVSRDGQGVCRETDRTPTRTPTEPHHSPSSPGGDGDCSPAIIDPETFGDEYAEAEQIEQQDPTCWDRALDAAGATLTDHERDLITAEDPGDRLHEQRHLHDQVTARAVRAYDDAHDGAEAA